MLEEGGDPTAVRRAHVIVDSRGLAHLTPQPNDPHKREFAMTLEDMKEYGFHGGGSFPLAEVVERVHPTILVGTSGTPGLFTREIVTEMSRHVERPVILALCNPTSKCECTPEEAMNWSDGRALVATGSPFAPVQYDGRTIHVGQANNVFIFPGVGLGVIVSETREVTESMFLVAARTLADCVEADRLAVGALYPKITSLRDVSRRIAVAVVREAQRLNLGRLIPEAEIEEHVEREMWQPRYRAYVYAGGRNRRAAGFGSASEPASGEAATAQR